MDKRRVTSNEFLHRFLERRTVYKNHKDESDSIDAYLQLVPLNLPIFAHSRSIFQIEISQREQKYLLLFSRLHQSSSEGARIINLRRKDRNKSVELGKKAIEEPRIESDPGAYCGGPAEQAGKSGSHSEIEQRKGIGEEGKRGGNDRGISEGFTISLFRRRLPLLRSPFSSPGQVHVRSTWNRTWDPLFSQRLLFVPVCGFLVAPTCLVIGGTSGPRLRSHSRDRCV